MKTILTLATAALLVGATAASAGHLQVGDAARTSDGNQSGNAAKGWDKLSENGSDGKAAAAANKTD